MANRPLTDKEYELAKWMLINGKPEALGFLSQLYNAEVKDWKCPCGCGSIKFKIADLPDASPVVHVLGDYIVVENDSVEGIFIYECDGVLAGIEVYGFDEIIRRELPSLNSVKRYEDRYK